MMPGQKFVALELANHTRHRTRVIKECIGAGKIDPAKAIAATDSPMYVRDMLMAIPGVGSSKAKRVMVVAKIPPNRRTRDLTDRQREALAFAMRIVTPLIMAWSDR